MLKHMLLQDHLGVFLVGLNWLLMSDMKLSNFSYDKIVKLATLKLGSETRTFDPQLLSVTTFNIAGIFIENHMMNHDVDGVATGYKIDENNELSKRYQKRKR